MDQQVLNKFSELLTPIDNKICTSYKNAIKIFTDYVNNAIKTKGDLSILIGLNPFELVEMNHENHANFMYSIFISKDVQSMHDTYIWAYKTYHAKGFNFRYFYLELIAWRESFELEDKELYTPIIELYKYLISLHDYFIQHATSTENDIPQGIDRELLEGFLNAILKPDINEAISISNAFIKEDKDIKFFWEQVILPALYSVGNKWADAEISVGEEHTATSICQRVMSEHYAKIVKHIKHTKKILVTTSPNELQPLV